MTLTAQAYLDDATTDALINHAQPILSEGDFEERGAVMIYRVSPGDPAHKDGTITPGLYVREVRGKDVLAYQIPEHTQAGDLLDYLASFKS